MKPKRCKYCDGFCDTHQTVDAVPANDIMKCTSCGRKTYRYEDTRYEGSKISFPKKYPVRVICPECKSDGQDLLPLPAGVYPAENRFRCKTCNTKFTRYNTGAVRKDEEK